MKVKSQAGFIQKILIAVTGVSPAILTETVWALAQGDDPWIPDQVIAVTTRVGRRVIEEQLLIGGGWDRLRSALAKKGLPVAEALAFGASDSIRVIGDGVCDFEDITTQKENGIAADFILGVLRQYTELADTEIVASIAGGRKTMSALMMSCMSLLGREQDRVCHVLANDEYLRKNPSFCFPANKKEEKAAQIQLSDIPFIRVRGWYEQEAGRNPASYSHMVSLFRKAAPPAVNYPVIVVKKSEGKVFADGNDLGLSPKEFLLCMVLAEKFLKPGCAFASWEDVSEEINEAMKLDYPYTAGWHEKMLGVDYRQARWSAVASDIRKKRLDDCPYANALIPGPGDHILFPKNNISIEC
jgi:CRISPR-associated protein (TIGR02584 family)